MNSQYHKRNSYWSISLTHSLPLSLCLDGKHTNNSMVAFGAEHIFALWTFRYIAAIQWTKGKFSLGSCDAAAYQLAVHMNWWHEKKKEKKLSNNRNRRKIKRLTTYLEELWLGFCLLLYYVIPFVAYLKWCAPNLDLWFNYVSTVVFSNLWVINKTVANEFWMREKCRKTVCVGTQLDRAFDVRYIGVNL